MATRDYTKPDSKINAFKDEYSDLDVMFIAHPISGDVAIKKDSDAVKRSVRNILLTNNYERPFKPNFGANLRARLFELNDFGMKDLIVSDIQEALVALEPRIRNVRCRIVDSDDNNINITVFYTIINGNRSTQTDVKINRIR
tara:strand:- start:430 stop:855 length:426 start_codon:yes stop_codon:yes gene_type:complete